MKTSSNLFLKMFVGFWLATVTIAASWMLTNQYFEAQPNDSDRRLSSKNGPPHRFMLRNIYTLQHADVAELEAMLKRSAQPGEVLIYLLDREGQDYLARPVPDIVRATAQQLDRRRRGITQNDGTRYIAHKIYRSDSGRLRAVFVFQPPPSKVLRLLGASPALRLVMAVAISGVVCFFLSRLLTRRIEQLRKASHELAGGNLDSRAPVRATGGDETDQLARDFNSMADQLQERILWQKRLLSDVSHELRSPLARLQVALALARRNVEQSTADGTEKALQRIELEAQRLEELIAQLLSSQAESEVLDQHIDLVSLLEVVSRDARFEGNVKQVNVNFQAAAPEAVVTGNGELLRKCFDNILRNALAHTPQGSTVSVQLTHHTHGYVVTVEDAGPGVPEEDLARIFTQFFRVDSARARDTGGYGLGLAIAKRAVTLHGGQIEAANLHPGLRVTVALPKPQ